MPSDAIALTIQSAVAPVFLFAGISGMLNVIGMRLSRAVDRMRVLDNRHANTDDVDDHNIIPEMNLLERRIKHSNRATTLCVASALAVTLVVIFLFVSPLISYNLANCIALFFVIAMVLLAGGLIEFLTEIRIAVRGRSWRPSAARLKGNP
jgi:hypothetical protein